MAIDARPMAPGAEPTTASDRGAAAKLSLFDATLLVIGSIIGVGVFFTPQRIAALAGDSRAFLALWVAGGVVALAGSFTFAELAGSFPREGGWFVYLKEAFGPFPAFLFAWIVLFVVSTGAVAVVTDFAVTTLADLVAPLAAAGPSGHRVTGVFILVSLTAVALLGTKPGARLQDLCVALKVAAILAIAVGGFVLAAAVSVPTDAAVAAVSTAGAPSAAPPWRWSLLFPAMLPVLFSYGGWQLVTYIAPEVRDAGRNVPRALVLGLASVVTVYLAFNAACLHVLGLTSLAASPGFAAEVATRAFGPWGGDLVRIAMAISAIGITAAILLASPGLYVAMAREGLFFRRFARTSPRTGAPALALLVQCAVAVAYFLWGRAGLLTDAVVFAEWIFHALAAAALLRLRRVQPSLPRPFRSPAYPLAPLLYGGIAGAVVLGAVATTPVATTGLGLGLLAIGAISYLPWRARRHGQ